MAQKDTWDKADILIKALVPVVIAVGVFLLNSQFAEQQASSTRIKLALEILKQEPLADKQDENIRLWAASVMQNPSAPIAFTNIAKEQLRFALIDKKAYSPLICDWTAENRKKLATAIISSEKDKATRPALILLATMKKYCEEIFLAEVQSN
ncbi:hypothetical protein ACQU0X_22270 [Pseudovibrio ascidiaceicola]|uniref:hypothetical protein n=1 Tax=Pseudovibrio ascidiaceicola TaxID=285279 RepID=UPI003D367657